MLTIFTPTYNRANEIKRLYASLKAQTNREFEWVVVDDGYSDNTCEVMQEFISEEQIPIVFFSQKIMIWH